MAEPVHAAIKRLGLRLRVYGPVGELVPGMAYLVRRLLENTSNESFVRHRFAEGRALDELVAPAGRRRAPRARPDRRSSADTDAATPDALRARAAARVAARLGRGRRSRVAVDEARDDLGARGAGAHRRRAGAHRRPPSRRSTPPRSTGSSPPRRRAPRPTPTRAVAAAVRGRAGVAAHAGRASAPRCCSAPPHWMRERRDELAALECFEAAKPWDQADADVCEAIDFCEYYGREVLRLDGAAGRPGAVAARARRTA